MDERPGPDWDGALPAPEGLVRGDATPSLAARLERWLADARVEHSADARARERWLHAAATSDSTFAGVLLDLAERGVSLALGMTGGRRHHGRIEVLGADFAGVRTARGAEVLLLLATITSVRTGPLVPPAIGDRVVTTDLRLTDVLAELLAERSRVLLVARDGQDSVAGELRAVGADVVTIRTAADPPATAYVPTLAIAEVALG